MIGDAYRSLGDVALARASFDAAATLLAAAGDRRGARETMLSLANAYSATGAHDTAITIGRKALEEFADIEDENATARTLGMIATSERALGRLNAALEDTEQALHKMERVRARVANADLRATYVARRYDIARTQLLCSWTSMSEMQRGDTPRARWWRTSAHGHAGS